MATKGRRSGLSLKLLLRAVGIVALCAILSTTAVATPVIVTEDGPLTGITLRYMNEYLGIPLRCVRLASSVGCPLNHMAHGAASFRRLDSAGHAFSAAPVARIACT
jgi:hypothetical protein